MDGATWMLVGLGGVVVFVLFLLTVISSAISRPNSGSNNYFYEGTIDNSDYHEGMSETVDYSHQGARATATRRDNGRVNTPAERARQAAGLALYADYQRQGVEAQNRQREEARNSQRERDNQYYQEQARLAEARGNRTINNTRERIEEEHRVAREAQEADRKERARNEPTPTPPAAPARGKYMQLEPYTEAEAAAYRAERESRNSKRWI